MRRHTDLNCDSGIPAYCLFSKQVPCQLGLYRQKTLGMGVEPTRRKYRLLAVFRTASLPIRINQAEIIVRAGIAPAVFPCRRFTVCCLRFWATGRKAAPERIELVISALKGRRPDHLDDGAVFQIIFRDTMSSIFTPHRNAITARLSTVGRHCPCLHL